MTFYLGLDVDLGHRRGRHLPMPIEDRAQTVGQHVCAAGLGDEIDCSVIQRLQFPLGQGVSRQDDDWQSNPPLFQRAHQIEP
ncbi:hypothetical protein SAMN02990966_07326 [Rhodospirillales bacterium URHD0017]|nr:hypothetical protein SAMN02990966_07326 [Rhodospirillales bacterium URHD0017]